MDTDQLRETLELHSQNIAGLMDNQLAFAAQVHVMQAARLPPFCRTTPGAPPCSRLFAKP